ncbi:MAG: hypothetical protein Q4F21_00650 [Lachnospiraceae bacterium]|nr:hypothetical protein [Lachnospiraceae bacterium]
MKNFIKCFFLAALLGSVEIFSFLNHELCLLKEQKGEFFLSDVVLSFALGAPQITTDSLIRMLLYMMPVFLFQILFGTIIYQRFCTASVYYFSREANRIHWFLKQILFLLSLSFFYLFTILLVGTSICSRLYLIHTNITSFILIFYFLSIHSLWLFLTTLAINLISIKAGSNIAFSIIGGVQLLCISSLILWKDIFPLENTSHFEIHGLLLQINPISHLILSWHSSSLSNIQAAIQDFRLNASYSQLFQIDFDLNFSVLIFAILSIFLIIAGCRIVFFQEFIITNKETGGMI